MAAISNNDIAKTIYLLTQGKTGAELQNTLQSITRFLAKKRLLNKTNAILSRLRKMINDEEGVVEVRVTSAEDLGDEAKRSLKHSLKERYKAKEINFTEMIDKSLLGGFKVEVNDEVIDFTVKNKIKKLKEHLTR